MSSITFRKSPRAQWWDYSYNGLYFITICTQDKRHYFGKVSNGIMNLSEIGTMANVFWYETINHFDFVQLDEFVVMPNHVHGIVIINKSSVAVGTGHALSLPQRQMDPNTCDKTNKMPGQKRRGNQGKHTLSSIIGSYKSAVTQHVRRRGFKFNWQTRFYDNIIRNEQAYHNIKNYIRNNPKNWNKDRFCKLKKS